MIEWGTLEIIIHCFRNKGLVFIYLWSFAPLNFLNLETCNKKHKKYLSYRIDKLIISKVDHWIVILPGGRDCFSFSAFSLSVMTRVYRNLEHLTLNLTLSAFFFILTAVKQKNIKFY